VAGIVVKVVILRKAKARNSFIINIFNIIEYTIDLNNLEGIKNDRDILDNN